MNRKIFVISDTWFNRPFDNYADMQVVDYNNLIINIWNKHIGKNDIVYVLGGFGISDLYGILVQLSGEIHFLNNYYTDDDIYFKNNLIDSINNSLDKKLSKRIFFENEQIIMLKDNDCVLSYFPLINWYGKDSETFCFHGFTTDSEILSHNISCNFNLNKKPINICGIRETIESIKDNIS